MSVLRTFIAITASVEVQGNIQRLIEHLQSANANVKWVLPDHLHLTLKFLGDVPESEIHKVCEKVQQAAADFRPFTIGCQGAGAFPDPARPRTVWIGVEQGAEKTIAMQSLVDKALQGLGFPKEGRRFHPHLTIGRVRRGGSATFELGNLISEHADFAAGQSVVDEVIVFSSELTRTGPEYIPLSRVKLKS